MSTSGSFVPASVPECPYAPRMTHAAAVALAAAAGLKENCVVVITDGPTIGTAGNTSVTEIELNPVSPTAFGQTARVFTTFAAEAWPGVYDVANNAITELRDDFGNVAKDVDAAAGSPTVHTQFPWHLGSATLRDNYLEDSTLTGWDTQTGSLINNRVIGSTVTLTGKTAGTIQDTTFQTANVVLGAGGGTVNISRSHVSSSLGIAGTPMINHTGTGTYQYADVIHRDGVTIAHSSVAILNFFNATIQNHNFAAATVDINHAGTVAAAQLSIGDSIVTGPGSGAPPWIDNQAAGGTLVIQRSELNGARIVRAAGSTAPISINQAKLTDTTINEGAANAGVTNIFNNTDINQSVFNLNGPLAGGRNDFFGGFKATGLVVNVAATATAGVNFTGGTVDSGTVNQNRTAGTGSTGFFSSHLRGFTTVTDNGTVDPGSAGGTANSPLSLNRLTLVDTAVTIGNVTGKTGSGTILQQVDALGSTLTITGPNGSGLNDFIDKLRVHAALFVNGGFRVQNGIVDGVDITMTADQVPFNSPKLANAAFTNWV